MSKMHIMLKFTVLNKFSQFEMIIIANMFSTSDGGKKIRPICVGIRNVRICPNKNFTRCTSSKKVKSRRELNESYVDGIFRGAKATLCVT